MSDLPEGWVRTPLDQIAEVKLGRQRTPKNHSGTQMRPYLRAANVTWGGLDLSDVKQMNFTDAELAVHRLEPGDILLSEASGSPSEVGKAALWCGEIADCAFQNTLLRVRPFEADPVYLRHYFHFLALSGKFSENSRGVGIHHLGRAALAAQLVPVPPLDEQRRIVELLEDHLSRLDAAEAVLEQSARRAEAMYRGSLWQLTHAVGGDKLRLDEVAEVRLGRQRSPSNHTGTSMRSYLRAGNVDWNRLRLDDVKQMNFTSTEEATFQLARNDILVVEASGSAGEVGKSALYRGQAGQVCFQNTLLRVRCHAVDPEFMQKYLLAEAMNGRFLDGARGVGIHHIGRARLASWPVLRPSLEIQRATVADAEVLDTAKERLVTALKDLSSRSAALRRAVLAAAFSGYLQGFPRSKSGRSQQLEMS